MLYLVISLFAAAAVAGLVIASSILRKKETPKPVVFIHGGLAAAAIVGLIYYSLNSPNSVLTSILLFVLAAIGGFYMFYRDLTKKPGSITIVAVHGLVAVAGFLLLLIVAFA